jgi:hypothetical protein
MLCQHPQVSCMVLIQSRRQHHAPRASIAMVEVAQTILRLSMQALTTDRRSRPVLPASITISVAATPRLTTSVSCPARLMQLARAAQPENTAQRELPTTLASPLFQLSLSLVRLTVLPAPSLHLMPRIRTNVPTAQLARGAQQDQVLKALARTAHTAL